MTRDETVAAAPGRGYGESMSTAEEPVRRSQTSDHTQDPHSDHASTHQPGLLPDWLPAATPTDGQPYKAMRQLREHPPSQEGRIYPKGFDSGGSLI